MPELVDSSQLTVYSKRKTVNREQRTVNRKSAGFSLIEIVLSLFIVIALLSILFTASATYTHSRKSQLQSLASKIASRDIESLRNTSFGSVSSGSISDPDLAKLPSSTATRTVANYNPDGKIKQVTITIDWTENQAPRQLKMETLISEYGL